MPLSTWFWAQQQILLCSAASSFQHGFSVHWNIFRIIKFTETFWMQTQPFSSWVKKKKLLVAVYKVQRTFPEFRDVYESSANPFFKEKKKFCNDSLIWVEDSCFSILITFCWCQLVVHSGLPGNLISKRNRVPFCQELEKKGRPFSRQQLSPVPHHTNLRCVREFNQARSTRLPDLSTPGSFRCQSPCGGGFQLIIIVRFWAGLTLDWRKLGVWFPSEAVTVRCGCAGAAWSWSCKDWYQENWKLLQNW